VFTGFKYILVVAVFFISILLLLPLLVFVWDVFQNPECIVLRFGNASYIDSEVFKVNITLSYCSSIPLKNVKIQIGSKLLEFDYINKGVVYTREIMLTMEDLEEGVRGLEASIGGFYKVVLKFKY
jgi:hypothetical protein